MECTNQTVLARSHAIILLPGGSQFMCVAPAARSMAFTRASGCGAWPLRVRPVIGGWAPLPYTPLWWWGFDPHVAKYVCQIRLYYEFRCARYATPGDPV